MMARVWTVQTRSIKLVRMKWVMVVKVWIESIMNGYRWHRLWITSMKIASIIMVGVYIESIKISYSPLWWMQSAHLSLWSIPSIPSWLVHRYPLPPRGILKLHRSPSNLDRWQSVSLLSWSIQSVPIHYLQSSPFVLLLLWLIQSIPSPSWQVPSSPTWSILSAPSWFIVDAIMIDPIYTLHHDRSPFGTHQHDDWSASMPSWSIMKMRIQVVKIGSIMRVQITSIIITLSVHWNDVIAMFLWSVWYVQSSCLRIGQSVMHETWR